MSDAIAPLFAQVMLGHHRNRGYALVMVSQSTRDELLRLSPADRIRVAQDLWDSVVDSAADAPLSQSERDLLDQRLAAYQANPQQGADWDTVRERVQRGGSE